MTEPAKYSASVAGVIVDDDKPSALTGIYKNRRLVSPWIRHSLLCELCRSWCYGGWVAKDDGGRLGVAAALVRGAFLVNAVYAESARECGLTAQQGQLLCVLMAQPYGMGELSAMLGLAKSSLTGLVDRTERNGLVRREGDPLDTRAVRVALTPQGGALVEEFYAETSRRVERLSAGLGEAEREELGRLLGRVVLDNEVPVVFLEMDSPAFHGAREE